MKLLLSCVFLSVFSKLVLSGPPRGNLIFVDEFNGNGVDESKWNFVIGDGCGGSSGCGFGNNEKQFYDRSAVTVQGGKLVITARSEAKGSAGFVSGKLTSKQRFKLGYYEVKAKLTKGRGLWHAFWLLGDGKWPDAGELDVLEGIGADWDNARNAASAHTKLFNNMNGQYRTKGWNVPNKDQFHTFGVERNVDRCVFYMDDVPMFTTTAADNPNSWPFNDANMYMILNLAVGGQWGGKSGIFPNEFSPFEVEYVKVWSLANGGSNTPAPTQGPTAQINWQGKWAYGCDWNGNDLTNAPTTPDQCGPKCAQTPGCTHFTWGNFGVGTCYMKQGAVTKNDAKPASSSLVCGLL